MWCRLKTFFITLLSKECSAKKLSVSFCVGNYIAFSPFIGLHGVMVFLFSWLFGLNFAIMFAAAYGINNIWTAIPIYTADYLFGHWLVHSILHLPVERFTPTWMLHATDTITYYTGLIKPCLWSFLIGGNLLGVLTSILLYPVVLQACHILAPENPQQSGL